MLTRHLTLLDTARPDEAIVMRIELVRDEDGVPIPAKDPLQEWRIVYESEGQRLTPREERNVLRSHLDRLGGDLAGSLSRLQPGRGRPKVTMDEARTAAAAWHSPVEAPLSNWVARSRRGTVADALGISLRGADDRIADARRRGLLEPRSFPTIDNEWSRRKRLDGDPDLRWCGLHPTYAIVRDGLCDECLADAEYPPASN